jgi:hypothetical protein
MFTALEKSALAVGLRINMDKGKTELMCVGESVDRTAVIINLSGAVVCRTDSYKYLGAMISDNWRHDWKKRVGIAWSMAKRLRNVWSNPLVDVTMKRRLFSTLVAPVLTYSSFRYPLMNITCAETIHRSSNVLLRYCLDDSRYPHSLHTEDLYVGSTVLFLPALMLLHNLSALGHWMRDGFFRGICHPCVQVLLTESPYVRKSGGQLRGPSSTILHFMACRDAEDLGDVAQNRKGWRAQVIEAVTAIQLRLATRTLDRRMRSGTIGIQEHYSITQNIKQSVQQHLSRRVD